MSSKNERRKQKAREKRKKARAKAAADAAGKRKAELPSRGLKNIASWPVSDCWVSGNWHEWEATVTALVTRRHPEGYLAAAIFEVDLAEAHITRASVARDLGVQQALIELSESDAHLESCEPGFVMRLLAEALDRNDDKPAAWGKAAKLLHDLEPTEGDLDIRWGYEDEEADTDEAPKAAPGLFDRVKGWFGR